MALTTKDYTVLAGVIRMARMAAQPVEWPGVDLSLDHLCRELRGNYANFNEALFRKACEVPHD